jgi:hypothetical protein
VLLLVVVHATFAGSALASNDNAGQIRALCATRFAGDDAAQEDCRRRMHVAATELVNRIEMAAEGTHEYNAAKACIERATVAKPAQIDWPRALLCFENRVEAGEVADPVQTQ